MTDVTVERDGKVVLIRCGVADAVRLLNGAAQSYRDNAGNVLAAGGLGSTDEEIKEATDFAIALGEEAYRLKQAAIEVQMPPRRGRR